jgi:hypothetical protein
MKFLLVGSIKYVNFDMLHHNGMNSTKEKIHGIIEPEISFVAFTVLSRKET